MHYKIHSFNHTDNSKKGLIVSSITAEEIIPNITIDFFKQYFPSVQFDYIDIMSFSADCKNIECMTKMFKSWLSSEQNNYDFFIGFAYGGVILQYSMDLIQNKKVILISSPEYINTELNQKLSLLSKMLMKNLTYEAIELLDSFVYTNQSSSKYAFNIPLKQVNSRLQNGFQMILKMDRFNNNSENIIKIVGEKSNLVNIDNIVAKNNAIEIPDAGMRVLEENAGKVQETINEFLN